MTLSICEAFFQVSPVRLDIFNICITYGSNSRDGCMSRMCLGTHEEGQEAMRPEPTEKAQEVKVQVGC